MLRKLKMLFLLLMRRPKAKFAFEVYRYNWIKKIVAFILPSHVWRFQEYGVAYDKVFDYEKFMHVLPTKHRVDPNSLDRKFMLYQLMKFVKGVPGVTAECGAYQGDSSYMICKYLGRDHHIFDSCEGVSDPLPEEVAYWQKGMLKSSALDLRNNLWAFNDQIVYHIGWIPEKFGEVHHYNFSFVHVDVDLAGPTMDCLQFFYPRIKEGGIILIDDYSFRQCSGVRDAVDTFVRDNNLELMVLTTGQAFIVKGGSDD